MTEIWRDIKDYEGLYRVNNIGDVINVRTGRILKVAKQHNGYLSVALCKCGKQKTFIVHRLVAEAFLQNPLNLPFINHKDECKTNNFVGTPENDFTDGNLEWCTHKYNINFGTRIERIKEKNINGKCSKQILQFSKTGEFIREWESLHEIQRQLGYYFQNIYHCCRGKYKQAYGFIWRYKEKEED